MERTTSLLTSIRNIEPDIISAVQDVSFRDINHFGMVGQKIVMRPVTEMVVAGECRNKCWPVSEAVAESESSRELFRGLKVRVTGIETPAGNHHAILVEDDNDGVIIDFTARQFDPNMSFPVIMDMWDWQLWAEDKIGRVGVWRHDPAY
jgi:hypothetical protein